MAGNEERVGRGLALVGRGLRPYVDRQMGNRHGPGWLAERSARDSTRLGRQVRHRLDDTRLLLALLTEEPFFKEIIPPPGVELASSVIETGDRLGFRAFQDAEAAQALRNMAQLLRLIGARDLSAEVQQLALPPKEPEAEAAPGPTFSLEKKKAQKPRIPFGRKPKKPAAPAAKSRWKVPQLRLGALLVGGLALLALIQVYGPGDSPDDPHEGRYADRAVGAELVSYRGIELQEGFHLFLLDDPEHPRKGGFRGDLFYTAGVLTATDRRLAVLPKDAKGSYKTCRDAKPRGSELPAADMDKGRRFCVITDKGAVGLLTITGRRDEPERAVELDLVVWKGTRPE